MIDVAREFDVAGHVTWEKRREFYEQRPLALASVIALTVDAPFLGLVLVGWAGVVGGLMLGAVAYWVGTLAITKVRELNAVGDFDQQSALIHCREDTKSAERRRYGAKEIKQ